MPWSLRARLADSTSPSNSGKIGSMRSSATMLSTAVRTAAVSSRLAWYWDGPAVSGASQPMDGRG
ncbi:hypothetical protein N4G70_36550 [Streptomyces sp. ASQP_92]|uniref:hypothetical protein n=1 Tax=Streptomyces sp. ASQP_92 TaxID=2979116 RepID=UPI0021BE0BA0|nr:hypothetical protein [Streptomyces sp. ASQP_92]MCT9094307.1 hypothetical protein [Streptomyces sp. ASQP_92]